jgi:Kazal-type serine protease inhibitor domain
MRTPLFRPTVLIASLVMLALVMAAAAPTPANPEKQAGATTCKLNSECDATLYCTKATGACKGTGLCVVLPAACPEYMAPICGCDGKTYNNDCEAHRNGVNVAHTGACDKKG